MRRKSLNVKKNDYLCNKIYYRSHYQLNFECCIKFYMIPVMIVTYITIDR